MYHDVVENGDFASSGFPGEGANVYKLRREDFEHHLNAIGAAIGTAPSAVTTVRHLEPRLRCCSRSTTEVRASITP